MDDHTTSASEPLPGAALVPIRAQRPAHWAWFDHALIDDYARHIGPIGVALYVALARYANHHTGQCWPSLVRLSQQLGMTRLTARRYLRHLVDHGLITMQERPGHTSLITLLALPPRPQTWSPSNQDQEVTWSSGNQGVGDDVTRGWAPGNPEPEVPNQQRRTSLGRVAPDQPTTGPGVPTGTDPLDTPSTPRDTDRADPFAGLPAAVQEALYAAATARLRAQGIPPAFLIRPVVLAEVQRALETLDGAPESPPAEDTKVSASAEAVQPRAVPTAAPAPTPARPPTLRDVTLADLRAVDRILALHHQAIARGWLRGSAAEQLTVVAAAVHALRVGQTPCRLFVALLKSQDWRGITQEDEDTARAWLRAYEAGPGCPAAPETHESAPARPLSADARFVDLVQAELAQWRLQQAQANARGGLTRLGALWEATVPWAESEDREADPDGEDDE